MKLLGFIDKNHINYDDKKYSYCNFFIEEYMTLLQDIGYDIEVISDTEMYIGNMLLNLKRLNITKKNNIYQYYTKYELINGLKFLSYYYSKKKIKDEYIEKRDEILKVKKPENIKEKNKQIESTTNTAKWLPNVKFIKNTLKKSGYLITQSGNLLIVNGKSDIYFSIKTKEFKNKKYSVKINNDLHLINSIKLYV